MQNSLAAIQQGNPAITLYAGTECAVKSNQRHPHALAVASPNQVSSQLVRNRIRLHIVMQAEVALFKSVATHAQQWRRRIVLG